MRKTCVTVLGCALLGVSGTARAEETPVTSKIVAVGLFKNGLAVVRREATLGKAGVYILDDVPDPVHGTYWVESAAAVETLVRVREVEVPATEAAPGPLQGDLAGKEVTVYFKDGKLPPVSGTVLKLKAEKDGDAYANLIAPADRAGAYLIVQSGKGRCYILPSEVAYVEARDPGQMVRRRKARLVLTLGATDKESTKVSISYLARGIAWAPAYKVDITDPKTLTLEQQAVIRNELTGLEGAELQLISGFPSVQFRDVTSPLSARTTWAAFFQQLNQLDGPPQNLYAANGVVYQQAVLANNTLSGPALPTAATAGEGVDLHYQSVGKRTLAAGDSLSLAVAKGRSAYERIVEWLVPDARDEWGRNLEGRGRGDDGDDSPWDALRFRNPLPFPMTTGPAMVTAGGNFNGQRTAYWANPGEETVVRIGKALSVRTRSLEHEEQKNPGDGRDLVWIGGRQFRRALVEGEIAMGNHRAEEVRLVVRRRFSGELLDADGRPKASLREEGVYSVNRRNELLWTLSLKPGEERVLKYRYAVLVAN